MTKLGCQQVQGNQALALVRSRHYYYSSTPMPAADYTPSAASAWPNYDGLSDFSRIQRQDAFFRAVVSRSAHQVTNPLSLNDFLKRGGGEHHGEPGVQAAAARPGPRVPWASATRT